MIPTSWYSHLCVVPSHIVPGLVCVVYSIWQKWWNVMSGIRLHMTVAFILSWFTLSLSSLSLEEASCHVFSRLMTVSTWWRTEAPSQQPENLPTAICVSLEMASPSSVRPWEDYRFGQQPDWNLMKHPDPEPPEINIHLLIGHIWWLNHPMQTHYPFFHRSISFFSSQGIAPPFTQSSTPETWESS